MKGIFFLSFIWVLTCSISSCPLETGSIEEFSKIDLKDIDLVMECFDKSMKHGWFDVVQHIVFNYEQKFND